MKRLQFKNIVADNKNLIYNQALYFTANREDAEDITQEVLIKLWHNMDKIKRNSLKAWVLKVTRNLSIDYSRRRKEQPLENKNDLLIDLQANPEKEAINADLMEKIMRVINQLPEKMRSIVIMRDIQDLKYRVIAETMKLPLNSVKVYLHRGRKLLLKNLSNYL